MHSSHAIRKRAVALLGVLALAATACGSDDDSADGSAESAASDPDIAISLPSDEMSDEDKAAIDATIQAALDSSGDAIPALYVGVWDPERGSYVAAYGDAEIDAQPADVGDSVRIGSISKTFTATVILQLVEEGDISLDEAIDTYVPDLVEQFPGYAGLTVRQLLSMHSGVPDYLNVPDGIVAAITQDPQRIWESDELIAAAFEGEAAPPDTPGYSTTNYIVLQQIAETVTGTPLADLVSERLTGPLGIDGTVLPPNDDTTLPDPVSHGYLTEFCVDEITQMGGSADVGTDATDWSASYGQGGGGMYSVVEDLGVWAASMSGNALLGDDLAAERLTTSDIGDGLLYGLGIMQLGPWIGHEGDAIGWETLAVHDPGTGATFVAASNTCGDVSLILLSALLAVYPDAPGF